MRRIGVCELQRACSQRSAAHGESELQPLQLVYLQIAKCHTLARLCRAAPLLHDNAGEGQC